MSLFIGALAFPGAPELVEEAKIGVLMGSIISAFAGYMVFRLAPPASDFLPEEAKQRTEMLIDGDVERIERT